MTRRERLAALCDELHGWRYVGALSKLATPEGPYRPQPWLAVTDVGAYYSLLQGQASAFERLAPLLRRYPELRWLAELVAGDLEGLHAWARERLPERATAAERP